MNDGSRYTDFSEDSASRTMFGDGRATVFKDKMTASEIVVFAGSSVFVAFLTAIIQTGFFFNFRPFGFAPDLCLALAAAAGIKFGPKCGSIVGIAAGFFIDAFSATGISLSIPFYLLMGIVMGLLAQPASSVNLPHIPLFSLGILGGTLVSALGSLLAILVTHKSPDLAVILSHSILPEMLCTLIFSATVYPFAVLISRIVRKKQGAGGNRS